MVRVIAFCIRFSILHQKNKDILKIDFYLRKMRSIHSNRKTDNNFYDYD